MRRAIWIVMCLAGCSSGAHVYWDYQLVQTCWRDGAVYSFHLYEGRNGRLLAERREGGVLQQAIHVAAVDAAFYTDRASWEPMKPDRAFAEVERWRRIHCGAEERRLDI